MRQQGIDRIILDQQHRFIRRGFADNALIVVLRLGFDLLFLIMKRFETLQKGRATQRFDQIA